MNNPIFVTRKGYHKERGSDIRMGRVYSLPSNEQKPVYMGIEVQEYSNQDKKWIGEGLYKNEKEALEKTERFVIWDN